MSILKRPEELIVAIIAALWVVLTYFMASYIGAPTQTTLLICALTLIVAIIAFLLWQRSCFGWLWPLFLGLLVACWWPLLDWLAIKDIILPAAQNNAVIISRPWYDTWTFKIIIAILPALLGYAWQGKRYQQQKRAISQL